MRMLRTLFSKVFERLTFSLYSPVKFAWRVTWMLHNFVTKKTSKTELFAKIAKCKSFFREKLQVRCLTGF